MTTEATVSRSPGGEGLEAIVLAGGAGVRFGGGKLLAPWRGRPLIEAALAAAFAAPARSVTGVTGADARVGEVAAEWARTQGGETRLKLVHAADHAEGMGASLRAGVRALPADASGVYVFLGDMPLISPETPAALADALREGALAVVPMFEGRRGHPVLFSAALLGDLAMVSGDAGARDLLRALGEGVITVDAPDCGVLFDVDSPDALRP